MNTFNTAQSASAAEADNWGDAPHLTEEMLTGTFWRLSSLDGGGISPFIVLAPEGRIGNFFHPDVDYWHVFQGRLCFVNARGEVTVIFNAAQSHDGTVHALAGQGNIADVRSVFILTVTQHPEHPVHPTPVGVVRQAHFLVSQPAPLRPNLVVVPANSASLHYHWLQDLPDSKRSWDLCVGYYGTERPFLQAPAEYLAHLPQKRKFQLLYDLFYEDSPLWAYERIWLPDDDLLISGQDLNLLFHLSRRNDLDLCQPSLIEGPNSFPTHPITVQRPQGGIRHERFVEIMCPLFSKRALKICIGSFRDSLSGYGLDHLWPGFLGRAESRMAILDDIGVAHTRPIGASYNIQAAIGEQHAMFASYGFTYRPIEGVK